MRFVTVPATEPTAPGMQTSISRARLSSPVFLKPLPLPRHSKGVCHARLFFSPLNAKHLPLSSGEAAQLGRLKDALCFAKLQQTP